MNNSFELPIQTFRRILSRYAQVPDSQWTVFESFVQGREIKKNSHLLKPGQISRQLTYNSKGLLRMYGLFDGEDISISFFSEGSLANSFVSFISQKPSEYGIQALEDTEVLTIGFDAMMKLGSQHPCWRELAIGASCFKLQEKEKRESDFLNRKAKERYLDFIDSCPKLVDRIPQYHLASYLGIKPESLSRIRKNLESSSRRK